MSDDSKRTLVDTAWDGTQEFAHFDSDGNLEGLHLVNDVEPIIDANKQAQCDGNKGYGETLELQHIARIPVSVLMEYCQKNNIPLKYALGGREQMDVIKRILKDPDYRYLRLDI